MKGFVAHLSSWIVTVSLILTACAPAAQPAAPTEKPAAPAAPASAAQPQAPAAAPAPAKAPEPKAVSEKPRKGGTFVITGDIFTEPPSLDTARRSSAVGKTVNFAATCRLVQWNMSPERKAGQSVEQVLPDLAESWESLDGGLKWVFHLRKGVKLPNGREVTSADVLRTFERDLALNRDGMRFQNYAIAAHTEIAKGKWAHNFEAPDRYTVVAKLRYPDADFLSEMGSQNILLYFEDFMEKSSDGWGEIKDVTNIRGCGPYYPTQYVVGSHMIFERNPNYYNPDLALVDRVNHRFIAESNVVAASFRTGQLDALSPAQNIATSVALELEKDPKLNVRWMPGAWYWPFSFDLQPGSPWRDVKVRRAFAMAIDHNTIIKDLYFGHGSVTGLFAPALDAYVLQPKDMGEDGKYYTNYNPQEAKRLLREAGYEKGFTFELQSTNAAAHVVAQPMFEAVLSYLEALNMGVKGNLKIIDYGASGGYIRPLAGIGTGGIIRPDLYSFAYSLIHPDFSTERVVGGKVVAEATYKELYKRDPEFVAATKLMDEQKLTIDPQKRLNLLRELQRIYTRNIWKYFGAIPDSPIITSKRVRGYNPSSSYDAGTWKYVWLAE